MCVLFFLVVCVPTVANASINTPVDSVPINGNITVSSGSVSNLGTGVVALARGQIMSIDAIYPVGLQAGDIVAVSIHQLNSDTSFGVKWVALSNYPYSSLLQVDVAAKTAYFKCLSSSCALSSVAHLQNDANYFITAFRIRGDNLADIKAYLNQFNNWFSTLSNRLINVNDTLADIRSKIDGIFTWFRSINDYQDIRTGKVLTELHKLEKLLKDQERDREEQKKKEQQANADAEKKKNDFSKKSDNDTKAENNVSKLSSLFTNLFTTSPKPPNISASYNGVKLDFDFDAIPAPPAWLIALEALPLFYISLRCFAKLLRLMPEFVRAWRDRSMSLSMVFDFLGV